MSRRHQRNTAYLDRYDTAQIAHDAAIADADTDACPGSCNDVWIAAERAVHYGRQPTHNIPMIAAQPIWCRPCQDDITATIAGFPNQCRPLTPGALNTPRDTIRPAPGIDPPSPSAAWDQADEIIRWAVNTEDRLRAHIGDHQFGQRPWRTLDSAVAYLTGHATALLSHPDAVAIGFDALRMARRLERVTGTDRPIHQLPGTCMACSRGSLQRKDGADLVKCQACGASWDWGHYQFLAKGQADAAKRDAVHRLVTAIIA